MPLQKSPDGRARNPAHPVVVIGAGFVGACIAYELRKAGWQVLLVDRDEPGMGASFGNSGAISPGSVAPVGMPGVVSSVPGMLLDREGALRLPLGYLPKALPWLLQFVAASRPARVEAIAARLAQIHDGALEAHRILTKEVGVPELFLQRGHLHLYTSPAARESDSAGWALRERYGYAFERVDREAIVALEPRLSVRYPAGVFVADHATICHPHRYLQAIVSAFVEHGGKVRRFAVRRLERHTQGWCVLGAGISEPDTPIIASHVVVAAGAWSRSLLDPIGLRLPLESQRGYHLQFANAAGLISRTVVLVERKVFVTPMEPGLRVGGMVEIGGLNRPPDPVCFEVLRRVVNEAFASPQDHALLNSSACSQWMGHRPCMADSVPVIGAAPGYPGLWLAVGHGHLGVTNSVGTGRMIAQLMAIH